MSIQEELDIRDQRYLFLLANRRSGKGDAYTAKMERFKSPRQLYQQLQYDGFRICAVCGATHVPLDHCDPTPKTRDRKVKSLGEPIKLPPAENAIPLFERLLKRLHRELQTLRGREDYLLSKSKSKKFAAIGHDGEKRKALGASWPYPPQPLTTLIAVYALVYGDADSPGMWKLIEKLHPSRPVEVRERMSDEILERFKKKLDPRTAEYKLRRPDPRAVDMVKLKKAIRHLNEAAGHVAAVVYGGEYKEGSPTPRFAPRYQAIVERVAALHRQGLSNAEIAEDINALYEGEWFEEAFTEDEVQWLIDLS